MKNVTAGQKVCMKYQESIQKVLVNGMFVVLGEFAIRVSNICREYTLYEWKILSVSRVIEIIITIILWLHVHLRVALFEIINLFSKIRH